MRENIEKPQFVYTGSKDNYSVKWFNTNIKAETNKSNSIHFIVVLRDKRIDTYFADPFKMIKYVKGTIEVKSKGRGKKYAEGKARVLIVSEKTKEEVLVATVEKLTTRYYEPVTRFDHSKKGDYNGYC